jgi:hypothetical protein
LATIRRSGPTPIGPGRNCASGAPAPSVGCFPLGRQYMSEALRGRRHDTGSRWRLTGSSGPSTWAGPLRWGHRVHLDLGRWGVPGHGHRFVHPPCRWGGLSSSTCVPNSSPRAGDGVHPTAPARRAHLPLRGRLPMHQRRLRNPRPGSRVVLSVGRRGQCWDNAVAARGMGMVGRSWGTTRRESRYCRV